MNNDHKFLRECIRQILNEMYDSPPRSDSQRSSFMDMLSFDIKSGKSQDADEQQKDQAETAETIFAKIDKNKNKKFDEDEVPSAEEWQEIKELLRSLFGARLMKARKQTAQRRGKI